jgi:hypothetical protein
MRAHEFVTIRHIDLIHEDLIRRGVLTLAQVQLSCLFENDKEYANNAKDFVVLQKNNTVVPSLGRFYSPIGLVFVNAAKLVVITTSDILLKLEDLPINSDDDYSLSTITGKKTGFPNNLNVGFSFGDTLFYDSIEGSQAALALILLKLSKQDWSIEFQIIQTDGSIVTRTN